ncbi:MAG: phosphotransferase [Anaerolineales bacterium]|nr:phosphotransferase [Anaerolineales bacterium]
MLTLPTDFTRRITGAFGDDGAEWLRHFPATLEKYSQRWSLTLLPHFEPLSYNFVAPAVRQDGGEVVLKLGVPNPELTSEIEALDIYSGRAAARLIEADAVGGALLIEHLKPGTPLVEFGDDEKATEIAAQIMQRLWRPVPTEHNLRAVEKWALGMRRLREHYNGGTGPFPEKLIQQAEILFAELIASTNSLVVLHGDLHHWNILAAQREPWLALDPKGVVGDPAFEVAAWMHNPMPWLLEQPRPERILARRLDQFNEILGFDRQRMLDWSVAQAVLSAWWCVEDSAGCFNSTIAIAEVLSDLYDNNTTWIQYCSSV